MRIALAALLLAAVAGCSPAPDYQLVRVEVGGEGSGFVTYVLDGDEETHMGDLPWSEVERITLTDEEKDGAGHEVHVKAIQRPEIDLARPTTLNSDTVDDGTPAPCRILVDGKEVAKGTGTCTYTLR
ncbi:hypothetical protein OIE66_25645 [Nonomuraea sp. NBC_01738]|uniref:hypothetical protein n=1 Tax=Nonomuraea sp. NBC_01738 TaxID=2976003 RepID=UPI002E10A20E|nr:hypothetical protein OIE66_25645 [Nonomuraea sp. NBC_01738]